MALQLLEFSRTVSFTVEIMIIPTYLRVVLPIKMLIEFSKFKKKTKTQTHTASS